MRYAFAKKIARCCASTAGEHARLPYCFGVVALSRNINVSRCEVLGVLDVGHRIRQER